MPGPQGEDVAGISWESLRMLAGQTEVGKNVKKAQNPRLGCGGQPASRLWAKGGKHRVRGGGSRSCLAQSGDPAL